jgi:hypothetical protein
MRERDEYPEKDYPDIPPEHRARPLSAARVNQELRAALLTSFNFLGGVDYLVWLGRKHPKVYGDLLGRHIVHDKPGDMAQGLRIVVETMNVQNATPVSGVISSPVAGHIDPHMRLIASQGEVIDAAE